MYMLTEVEKVVRIPPKDLKDDIDSVIDSLTWETYEGRLGEDKNFTVLIKNVRTVGPGRIVHGDGAVYQTVKFDQVVFKPRDNEIIIGKVVEILKFGAFVRFGPLDGLLHISQVMDDRVDIDETPQREEPAGEQDRSDHAPARTRQAPVARGGPQQEGREAERRR